MSSPAVDPFILNMGAYALDRWAEDAHSDDEAEPYYECAALLLNYNELIAIAERRAAQRIYGNSIIIVVLIILAFTLLYLATSTS